MRTQGHLAFADSANLMPTRAPSKSNVFRPVQYLGNKLRALEHITAVTSGIVNAGAPVVDLFSGTPVVSQALAQLGNPVVACDA